MWLMCPTKNMCETNASIHEWTPPSEQWVTENAVQLYLYLVIPEDWELDVWFEATIENSWLQQVIDRVTKPE